MWIYQIKTIIPFIDMQYNKKTIYLTRSKAQLNNSVLKYAHAQRISAVVDT